MAETGGSLSQFFSTLFFWLRYDFIERIRTHVFRATLPLEPG
jgi:hypothetical protein